MKHEGNSSDVRTGLMIALSDLLHEWKLSSCLVLAIAAVIAPLLLLFGLKYGTIATLRSRLVDDPKNREIIPVSTRNYTADWFERLSSRSDVAFLIPVTRQIAGSVEVRRSMSAENPKGPQLDIVPTGPGDVLLLENGATVPGEGECVLTRLAAEEAGARAGDTLTCIVNRSRQGRSEKESFTVQIKAVLPDRAGLRKALFLPLELVEAVEAYKDGRAVSRYNWPGDIPKASPRFDGALLLFPEALKEEERLSLTMGTGLSGIREIGPEEVPQILGVTIGDSLKAYLLQVQNGSVGAESLEAVKEKVRGRNALVIPYVKQMQVTLFRRSDGREMDLPILGYSAKQGALEQMGRPLLPAFEELKPGSDAGPILQIALPAGAGLGEVGETLTLGIREGDRSIAFPVRVAAVVEGLKTALVPAELMGILNTFRQREVSFSEAQQQFLLGRLYYAGFRMYARTIDDVEPLRRYLHEQGIEVSTKADEIERVKSMDRGLTRVFWLVAVVGIFGCMAALVASLASSVERKRRDLSVLRLMGMSGWLIFQVPVSQALFLGITGFAAASMGFFIIAALINQVFAADLLPGEKMCRLAAPHFGTALLGTLGIVFFSSLFAAWQTTRIDPAEALRDE